MPINPSSFADIDAEPPEDLQTLSTDTWLWLFENFQRLKVLGDGVWEDMRAPASALTAGASVPALNTTFGWREFAHNQDDVAFFQFQLPHAWKEGTDLVPHVHWMKTTAAAGDVQWEFSYRWAPIGGVMDGSWTVLTADTPVAGTPDNDTQYEHLITSFGGIATTGREISDMLIARLVRLGLSFSGGGSNYGAPAALLEMDIHHQVNSFGSVLEFEKS